MSGEAIPPQGNRPSQRPPRPLGRRLGVALFWLMAAYVVGAASLSVIPTLYWPKHAPLPRAAAVTRCADQIGDLERSLLQRAGDYLKRPDRQDLAGWLSQWDRQLLALAGGCGPLDDARHDLQRLRNDVERMLRSYDREQAPIRDRIERLLSSYEETESS